MAKKVKRPAKRRTLSTALAVRQRAEMLNREPTAPGIVGLFEKIARDPDLTVEKLGALIALQERVAAKEAESRFDAAYREMLLNLPKITRRGEIKNKEKKVQSRYSKYEDLRKACDPILRQFGFTFHTKTEWPSTGVAEVVGFLEHQDGGRRESRFRSPGDESGNKNKVQALGSVVSYGKRYTYKDLLSIVEEGVDNDGQSWGDDDPTPPGVIETRPVKREPPPAGHHQAASEPITEAQIRKLVAVARNAGREAAEISWWLKARYGYDNSRQITRDKYEYIIAAIEAPGALR